MDSKWRQVEKEVDKDKKNLSILDKLIEHIGIAIYTCSGMGEDISPSVMMGIAMILISESFGITMYLFEFAKTIS